MLKVRILKTNELLLKYLISTVLLLQKILTKTMLIILYIMMIMVPITLFFETCFQESISNNEL
jgi:hypothetical protein